MTGKIELVHWNIRGFAQPIRFLLEYVGAEYVETRYNKDEQTKWFEKKANVGLDFPDLPYLVDGNLKISQSSAILRYVGDKFKLGGRTLEEDAILANLEGAIKDFRTGLAAVSFSVDYEQQREQYMEDFKTWLLRFSTFLGKKKFVFREEIKYVDFAFYEALYVAQCFNKSVFEEFENLVLYKKRFEEIPVIESYMNSDRFVKWPIHKWIASFGGEYC